MALLLAAGLTSYAIQAPRYLLQDLMAAQA